MSKTYVTWEVGDRVYLVADESLTGTIAECRGQYRRVRWDGGLSGKWCNDSDLEAYTRPEWLGEVA